MWKTAVFGRGIPFMLLEGNAEAVFTLKPTGKADVLYSAVCGLQIIDCLLETYGDQIAVRRDTCCFFKAPDEVRQVQGHMIRKLFHGQVGGEPLLHIGYGTFTHCTGMLTHRIV